MDTAQKDEERLAFDQLAEVSEAIATHEWIVLSSPPITEANEEAESPTANEKAKLTSGCKRVNVFSDESGTKGDASECPDPSEPCNIARIEALSDES